MQAKLPCWHSRIIKSDSMQHYQVNGTTSINCTTSTSPLPKLFPHQLYNGFRYLLVGFLFLMTALADLIFMLFDRKVLYCSRATRQEFITQHTASALPRHPMLQLQLQMPMLHLLHLLPWLRHSCLLKYYQKLCISRLGSFLILSGLVGSTGHSKHAHSCCRRDASLAIAATGRQNGNPRRSRTYKYPADLQLIK